jgi:serine/threonine-protein kinase
MHHGQWCSLWRARSADARATPDAEYALKISHGVGEADAGRQMLRREAAVSRAVSHQHLLPVLSSQLAHAPPYIVLPLLEGISLAEAQAAENGMPLGHALWIARQIAEGLTALHERNWLHGDVKPANIMVQPNGHATLIDLGFAQRFGEAAAVAARAFCGTIRYAAPERLTSATAIDGASDCYSLGAVLFELLASRPPFVARDAHALAVAHIQETPPDVRELSPQVPREASALVAQLLAKNPLRRPTAEELVARLCRLEIATLETRGEVTFAPAPMLPV